VSGPNVSLAVAIAAVVAGVGLLAGGGEVLVRGAVALARALGVSTAVIGLTVVAAGTSMPELSVSLLAAIGHQPDIAIGNIVGSNIFNIAVILGLAALFLPLVVHMSAVRLEWPVMFVTTVLFLLLARDGAITRPEGGCFLVLFVAFTAYVLRVARAEVTPADEAELDAALEHLTPRSKTRRVTRDLLSVVGGLAMLALGARVLILGGTTIAEALGVSQRLIGLTVAAAGTSLPELSASLVAARRGQADLALANVLGSNIFNILVIVGAVSLVTPQVVNPRFVAGDGWWMLGVALLLLPLMLTGRRITRREGVVLLLVYGAYLVSLGTALR
jgi:cation:H+ antiporter